MLSTRFGYLRPAFLAAAFALDFWTGESFLDFFPDFLLGLAFFQGGFAIWLDPIAICSGAA